MSPLLLHRDSNFTRGVERSTDKMRKRTWIGVSVILLTMVPCSARPAVAQPVVHKIEPPHWWTGTHLPTVELLLTGHALEQLRVQVADEQCGARMPRAGSSDSSSPGVFICLVAPGAIAWSWWPSKRETAGMRQTEDELKYAAAA
jgi:hypothetical protein